MNYYTFEELSVGTRDSIEVILREDDIFEFVKLSGDESPIHVDDEFARRKGFKNRIAHGVLLASYVSRFIGVHLPGANGLLQTIEMQFRRPCYPGRPLRIQGEVMRQIEAVRAVRIKITVSDICDGTLLATGTVQCGILDRPQEEKPN